KGYLQYLKNLLEEYDIRPENLEIEVTEGILLEKTESNMDFLREVRRLGLRLALDDFGSGYSSLSYLTFLPVNKIKLDKSINDKFLGMENIQVMQSIISLAHSLDLSITAEGIEEADQFQKLKTCGCDTIQGYLFARPQPAREMEKIYNQVFAVDGVDKA
ncbi:MAG: EAL domain-containing protein, partial [Eubacteriaceae bacterium]